MMDEAHMFKKKIVVPSLEFLFYTAVVSLLKRRRGGDW